MKEQVLVFPHSRLEPYLNKFYNYLVKKNEDIETILRDVLSPDALTYIDRELAESDPSYKQVIPYCVLTDGHNIFTYQRTKKGGESRLHQKHSIGVGGHINPCDEEGGYWSALFRELKEEIGLVLTRSNRPPVVALIYDPSNEVGQVHFGIVHLVHINHDIPLTFTDEALANHKWLPAEAVESLVAEGLFENWSVLAIQGIMED